MKGDLGQVPPGKGNERCEAQGEIETGCHLRPLNTSWSSARPPKYDCASFPGNLCPYAV